MIEPSLHSHMRPMKIPVAGPNRFEAASPDYQPRDPASPLDRSESTLPLALRFASALHSSPETANASWGLCTNNQFIQPGFFFSLLSEKKTCSRSQVITNVHRGLSCPPECVGRGALWAVRLSQAPDWRGVPCECTEAVINTSLLSFFTAPLYTPFAGQQN